jgi:predicted nucleic acid-binding protein
MDFLLDTNVVSELVRPKPSPHVTSFLKNITQPVISAITVAEIEYGVALRPEGKAKKVLEQWLLEIKLVAKILPVSESIAAEAGRMKARFEEKGRAITLADALIASTAIRHNLTLATRNTRDFQSCGAKVINPFHEKG